MCWCLTPAGLTGTPSDSCPVKLHIEHSPRTVPCKSSTSKHTLVGSRVYKGIRSAPSNFCWLEQWVISKLVLVSVFTVQNVH
jgi:hypothetical protein